MNRRGFMKSAAVFAGLALAASGTPLRLVNDGGVKPVHVVDFGPDGVGGYAVFSVTAFKPGPGGGLPVLRLSYAAHPDGLGEMGCFTRETCAHYLGVDNPVLPANVNRHELYTICRTGTYVAPLLQGLTRYVRLQLDTPGEVEFDSVRMVNADVYMSEPTTGAFRCSDERMNKLWHASERTCRLAAFPNHDAWKCVGGRLLPRKLERGGDTGWCRFSAPSGAVLEISYEFRTNPHFPETAFKVVTGDGTTSTFRSVWPETEMRTATAALPRGGRFGIRVQKESWPLIDSVTVRDASGREVFRDDFSRDGAAENWEYARTRPYVSDGAKRDRLVWSGDLWWAQRCYYALYAPDIPYMRGSLELLAFNQTPEGYVHAAPYAESQVPPPSGDWSYFPSDEFSAWFVPVLRDHWLHVGDRGTIKRLYPAMRADMDYLERNIGPDGIFVQRVETSKHAMFHFDVGDVTRRSYMNILLWKCFRDAADVAAALGRDFDSGRWRWRADEIAAAVRAAFWDGARGCFVQSAEWRIPGFEANALALATHFATGDEAERIAPHLVRHNHGKFQMLAARGKFEYGFAAAAMKMLEVHDWYALCDPSWPGLVTIPECMHMRTKGNGDEAHPDVAVGSLFLNYVLGLEPLEPGWRRFRFRPQPGGVLKFAEGRVKTPFGFIEASWRMEDGRISTSLAAPPGTEAETDCEWGMSPKALETPPPPALEGVEKMSWSAAESREEHMWRLSSLDAPLEMAGLRGYSSRGSPTAETNLWLELDMGIVETVKKATVWPQATYRAANGLAGGFPRNLAVQIAVERGKWTTVRMYDEIPQPGVDEPLAVDFHTVTGFPKARYLRFSTTRLGEKSTDHDDYRLQVRRITIERSRE